jgi:hypothetical protein
MKTRMSSFRSNYEDLISPDEVAELIINSISTSKTLVQNEILIRRK